MSRGTTGLVPGEPGRPPDPDVIVADIIEDLQAALEQFAAIHADLAGR